MMFENLLDPLRVESEIEAVKGFARFKGDAIFQEEKIVQKGSYNFFGSMGEGYEIHNATTKKRSKKKKNLYGTFIHGLFDSDGFRDKIFSEINSDYVGYDFNERKANAIKEFALLVEKNVDMQTIVKELLD